MNCIHGVIILVGLIVGFGAKLYFGEVIGEKTEDMIEKIIEEETGVSVEPLFELDDVKK